MFYLIFQVSGLWLLLMCSYISKHPMLITLTFWLWRIEILRTNNILQSHYKFVRMLWEYILFYGLKLKNIYIKIEYGEPG